MGESVFKMNCEGVCVEGSDCVCTWLRIGSNCGLVSCRNETPGSSKLESYFTDFMKLRTYIKGLESQR